MPKRVLEQHIAVFGESGSGKTVLLSSFYGLVREKRVQEKFHLDVVADDTGQGNRLLQNYLGMSREGRVPPTNRFSSVPYSFTAHVKQSRAPKTGQFEALRLVWHDYPGEWFQQSPSGPEEAERRSDTFRALLASDVALVLVDGEQLLRHSGSEEKYLKLLFGNIRDGLLPVFNDLQSSKKRIKRFPRIWMFALSKSDLLPELDVEGFRDLVVLKAAYEVDKLRELLEGVVVGREALAVGEDFVRLSSAEFGADAIDVQQRVGLDLLMPIASVLPVARFLRWAERQQLQAKILRDLIGPASVSAATIALLLGVAFQKVKLPGPLAPIVGFLAGLLTEDRIKQALAFIDSKLDQAKADALARGDYLRAALAQFGTDLDEAEERGVLLRSKR